MHYIVHMWMVPEVGFPAMPLLLCIVSIARGNHHMSTLCNKHASSSEAQPSVSACDHDGLQPVTEHRQPADVAHGTQGGSCN